MRGFFNDCLRGVIGAGIAGVGLASEIRHRLAVRMFYPNQRRLRRRYRITRDTPVLSYGLRVEELIEEATVRAEAGARFAFTSGSTASPKRILYTKARLRRFQLTYQEVFARCFQALRIRRKSLYIFGSFHQDNSLTSILLEEARRPPYLVTLQAPYRVERDPAIQALACRYGPAAVRLWLLAIANPGVLYTTNPSTLSTFLDEVALDWPRSSRLVRDWCERPLAFDPVVRRIARRLESRGSAARLALLARSDPPVSLQDWAPGVEAYVCWTGGYVQPFLDRIAKHLPPQRYRLIPMFSMATESIETISHFRRGQVAFLPLAKSVLYEFLEEGEDDRPENLKTPERLQPGKPYTMILSDPWGLRRYQTGDVFLCRGFIAGLPDLVFVRRRGLEYSFTGEKLTAGQASLALEELRRQCAWLRPGDFLTCLPSWPPGEPLPHYKIARVGAAENGAAAHAADAAARCEALLCRMNPEYRSKRESGRLGPVRFLSLSLPEFVAKVYPAAGDRWQAQLKFLPLYQRTWESLEAEHENRPDA